MKLIFLIILLFTGCAHHSTIEQTYNPETKGYDITKFTGTVWFNRSAIKGLTVGKRTEKGSTTLSLTEGSTETQSEAIKAIVEGAVSAAIKAGTKP
jgi:hypothetical protein